MMRINAFVHSKANDARLFTAHITLSKRTDYRKILDIASDAGAQIPLKGLIRLIIGEQTVAFAGGLIQTDGNKEKLLGKINGALEEKDIPVYVSDYIIEHL